MIEFSYEGLDEGLHIIRTVSGERRRLTSAQFEEFAQSGDLPDSDAVAPIVPMGHGEHPMAQAQGLPPEKTAEADAAPNDAPAEIDADAVTDAPSKAKAKAKAKKG